MTITRPLLAATVEDVESLKFPLYATPKLDGIRVLKVGGKIYTRNFKELPNLHARAVLEKVLPDGIDGEIMLRDNTKSFNDIQSEIMRHSGEPDFVYYAFDYVKDDLEKGYLARLDDLEKHVAETEQSDVLFVIFPEKMNDLNELIAFEEKCEKLNYEGVMLRAGDSKYKCGRSTVRESILMKVKKFADSEAEILGFVEKMTNTNAKEKDAFGKSKRSSKKEGKVPAGTLGAIMVKSLKSVLVLTTP